MAASSGELMSLKILSMAADVKKVWDGLGILKEILAKQPSGSIGSS